MPDLAHMRMKNYLPQSTKPDCHQNRHTPVWSVGWIAERAYSVMLSDKSFCCINMNDDHLDISKERWTNPVSVWKFHPSITADFMVWRPITHGFSLPQLRICETLVTALRQWHPSCFTVSEAATWYSLQIGHPLSAHGIGVYGLLASLLRSSHSHSGLSVFPIKSVGSSYTSSLTQSAWSLDQT